MNKLSDNNNSTPLYVLILKYEQITCYFLSFASASKSEWKCLLNEKKFVSALKIGIYLFFQLEFWNRSHLLNTSLKVEMPKPGYCRNNMISSASNKDYKVFFYLKKKNEDLKSLRSRWVTGNILEGDSI